jgi:hypothetical protein
MKKIFRKLMFKIGFVPVGDPIPLYYDTQEFREVIIHSNVKIDTRELSLAVDQAHLIDSYRKKAKLGLLKELHLKNMIKEKHVTNRGDNSMSLNYSLSFYSKK